MFEEAKPPNLAPRSIFAKNKNRGSAVLPTKATGFTHISGTLRFAGDLAERLLGQITLNYVLAA